MSIAASSERLTLGPSERRLIGRLLGQSDRRPEAPRGFTVNNRNWFSWDPPQDQNFSHYRIRIGHDDGLSDIEVSRGTHGTQLFYGSVFYLSTYNSSNDLESYSVRLLYDAENAVFGGGTGAASWTENLTVTGSSFTATAAHSPTGGDQLTLIIEMNSSDATITITPDAVFQYWPDNLDTTQTTFSVLTFTGDGSLWVCTGWRTGLQ